VLLPVDLAAEEADALHEVGVNQGREVLAVCMDVPSQLRAANRVREARRIDADVPHGMAKLPRELLREAFAVVFAGEHGIDGGLQAFAADAGDELALREVIGVVRRGFSGVQHEAACLREKLREPAAASGGLAAGKFRVGVAEDETFFTSCEHRANGVLVPVMQRAELADDEAALEGFAHRVMSRRQCRREMSALIQKTV